MICFCCVERQMIDSMPMRAFIGDAETVYQRVNDLAERTLADELMVTTFLPETHDRRRVVTELARMVAQHEGWSLPAESAATG
jgi:alkanesulfonate monooxygenase SsuD/methylene tetrahydromethanopterin reductase-like flavin-dependent oxidoreductase (luciferase family)